MDSERLQPPPQHAGATRSQNTLAVQRRVAAIGDWVETGIVVVAAALLSFLVVALFLQVLYRYVLRNPLPWTEEGAGFALVWYAVIAAAYAARRGQQFVFRWLTLPLPRSIQKGLRQVVNVLTIVFLVVLLMQSIDYLSVVSGQTATATQVAMWLPYSGLVIGFAFLIVVYVFDTIDVLLSLVTKVTFSQRELQEAFMYGILTGTSIPSDEPDDAPTMRP